MEAWPQMAENPVWAICERAAEVQTLLDDHIAGGKHTTADVIAKAQAVLSEPDLLRAMFDVGYFPPNSPPITGSGRAYRSRPSQSWQPKHF
jgi:hypothetical protein